MFALTLARFIAAPFMAAAQRGGTVWERFSTWYEAHRAYKDLCALDDRNLADIGLSRSDLRSAQALNRRENPIQFLKNTRCERRTRSSLPSAS